MNKGYLLIEVHGLLIAVASPAVGHRHVFQQLCTWGFWTFHLPQFSFFGVRTACGTCSSWALEHKCNSCGIRAQLLHGTWDPLRPGIKPVSPAFQGGFFATESPGKPLSNNLDSPSLWETESLAFKTCSQFLKAWRIVSSNSPTRTVWAAQDT